MLIILKLISLSLFITAIAVEAGRDIGGSYNFLWTFVWTGVGLHIGLPVLIGYLFLAVRIRELVKKSVIIKVIAFLGLIFLLLCGSVLAFVFDYIATG